MSDVEIINVQDTVFSFFLSVCLFCFSTGVADIKAWPWSDPEPPVTSRSRSRLKEREFEFGFAPKQEQEYRLYQVLLWTGLGIEKIVQHIKWFEMRVDE